MAFWKRLLAVVSIGVIGVTVVNWLRDKVVYTDTFRALVVPLLEYSVQHYIILFVAGGIFFAAGVCQGYRINRRFRTGNREFTLVDNIGYVSLWLGMCVLVFAWFGATYKY